MSGIVLQNVGKTFDRKKTVLKGIDLTIAESSFTVLVGPSGCGKTTILRMIAGLEDVSEGTIHIGGMDVTSVPAEDRGIAMVFQNYAIYPHMSVRENIEFGLRNAKLPRGKRAAVIQDTLDLVGLTEYAESKPSKLSGGQRQRVALARAISKKPRVFLMDEPLSNLDAKLRDQMRTELIELHRNLKSTFVYVTHDQIEAMTMGERIVVMDHGTICQEGSPREIYRDPANAFVARFIGNPGMNILQLGSDAAFGFRPHDASFRPSAEVDPLILAGMVLTREMLGSETQYCVETDFGKVMVKSNDDGIPFGADVRLHIASDRLYFFDADGNRIRGDERRDALLSSLRDRYAAIA